MFQDYTYIYLQIAALLSWTAGAVLAIRRAHPAWVYALTIAGIAVYLVMIISMWVSLGHPPLRTMGETRMWYSLFMPVAGLIVYCRWRYRWILSYTAMMAAVFVGLNIMQPELRDCPLPPALQSGWFVPHVIMYMMAYALAATAMGTSVWMLVRRSPDDRLMAMTDSLIRATVAFMTVGMLLGALWAKQAWGQWWSWDPKETWAAATWLTCLMYIHIRAAYPSRPRLALWIPPVIFVLLQMCWWGINLLPWMASMHKYS